MLSPDKVANRGVPVVAKQDRSSQPVSPRYVFFLLWYRRYTIIAAVSATLLAALVYLIFSAARYTATTTLVLDFTKSPVAHNEERAEPRVDDDVVESNVLTIQSENVAAAVIKKLKLTDDPEFRPSGIMVAFQSWISDGAAHKTADSDEKALHTVMEIFKRGLSVTRIPKSYVV